MEKTIKKLFTVIISLLLTLTLLPATSIMAQDQPFTLGSEEGQIHIDYINVSISDKSGNYGYRATYEKNPDGTYNYEGGVKELPLPNGVKPIPSVADANTGFTAGATYEISLNFSPYDNGVLMAAGYPTNTITYQFPDYLKCDAVSKEPITDSSGKRMGSYSVSEDGLLTFTFNDAYLTSHGGAIYNCSTTINATLQSNKNGVILPGAIGDFPLNAPIKKIVVNEKSTGKVTKKAGNEKILYNSTLGKFYSLYYVTLEPDSGNTSPLDLSKVEVHDWISGGNDKYVDHVEPVNGYPTKGVVELEQTFDSSSGVRNHAINWTFPEGGTLAKGEKLELHYRVYYTDEFTAASVNSIKNYASLYIDGKYINYAQAETKRESSIKVAKSGTALGQNTAGEFYIDYTVKVTAQNVATGSSIPDVSVKDKITQNASKVKRIENVSNNGIVDGTTINWSGLTVNASGTSLTYRVVLKDDIFDNPDASGVTNFIVHNEATATALNRTATGKKDSRIYKKWVVKDGEPQKNGTVKFTLKTNSPYGSDGQTVYPSLNPGGEVAVMDILGTGWEYCDASGNTSGNLIAKRYTVVKQNGSYKLSAAQTINIPLAVGTQNTTFGEFKLEEVTNDKGEVHQEFTLNGDTGYYYVLEYYAVPTPDNWGASISNKGGAGINGGTTTYWHEYGYTGTDIVNVVVEKKGTGVNKTDNTAGWLITVNNPLAAGATITDYRDDEQKGGEFYLTSDQLAAIEVKLGGETLDTEYYTVTPGNPVDGEVTSFTIELQKPVLASDESPLTVSYRTAVKGLNNLDQHQSVSFFNKATVVSGGNEATAPGVNTFTRDISLSKTVGDWTGEYDYDDDGKNEHVVHWLLTVNEEGTLEGEATLVDNIPAGLEYMDYSFYSFNSNLPTALDGEPVVAANGNGLTTVTFKIKDLQKTGAAKGSQNAVYIDIYTKVIDENVLKSNSSNSFVNTATLEYNGGMADALATYTATIDTIDKTSDYVGNRDMMNMHFTIVVNPNGLDLTPGNDTDANKYVKVIDTMTSNVSLLTDSIVVEDENGTVVWTVANQTDVVKNLTKTDGGFSFEILDNAKYSVKYDVTFNDRPGTAVEVVNTVKYEGAPAGDQTDDHLTVYDSKSHADGLPLFYILKRDSADITKPIDGVVFGLYKVEPVFETNEDGVEELVEIKYNQIGAKKTTSSVVVENPDMDEDPETDDEFLKGAVVFDDLMPGVIYAYKEEKTIPGYYMNAEDCEYRYVIFEKYVDGENVTNAIIDASGLPQDIVEALHNSVFTSAKIVTAYNKPTEIVVTKTAEGADPNGTFYFGLFTSRTQKTTDQIVSITFPTKNPSAKFTNLANGTYYVYETDAEGNKLTAGDSVELDGVKYIVSDGETVRFDIKLDKPTEEGFSQEVEIVNTAVAELKVTKELVGQESGSFQVTVKGEDELYYGLDGTSSQAEIKLTVKYSSEEDADNSIVLKDLPIQKYTVSEVGDGDQTFNYVVTYTNNNVTVNSKSTVEVTVKNELKTGALEVKKFITGKENSTDKFNFTVEIKDKNNAPISGTFGDVEFVNGKVEFQLGDKEIKRITDLPAGTKYTVTEESAGGYTATKSGEAGEIVANDTVTASFTNNYSATPAEAKFSGVKTLSGRDLKNAEFKFDLIGADGKVIETVSNGTGGKIAFSKITYTEAGVYTYTVEEQVTTQGGVEFDDTVYNITVTVTDDGVGALHAKIEGINEDGSGLDFVNEYGSKPVSIKIGGNKTFTGFPTQSAVAGTAAKDAPTFEFELKENGKLVETKSVKGEGSYEFTEISYTTVGTHSYTVTEKNTGHGGVTYDATVYAFTVTVTDDGNGNLVKRVTGVSNPETLDFANEYESQPVKAKFTGVKTLTGRDLKNAEFKFDLIGADGKVIETVTNGTGGKIEFSEITYTAEGVYTYTVMEQVTTQGGVKFDDTVYNITVTVTDNGEGQLVKTMTGVNEDGSGLDFLNEYTTQPAYITVGVSKEFDGFPWEEDLLPRSEGKNAATDGNPTPIFTFELSEDDEVIDSVTIQGSGWADFEEIEYNTPGTHNYKVVEVDGEHGGVEYDGTVYEFTVTVTDNGDGQLVKEVTGVRNPNALTFVNTYESEPVEVVFSGTKALEGRDLLEGEFKFQLLDAEGNLIEEVTNKADGTYSFSALVYKYGESGVYEYDVVEVDEEEPGMVYDTTIYHLVVTVEDDLNGHMIADITGDSTTGDDLDFNNEYEWGSLEIIKTVAGSGASKKKMFSFLVEFDFDGKPLEKEYLYTGTYTGFIKSGDTIELKHGESITILGLPKGAHYLVTEDKAVAKGYKIKMENNEGIIEKDTTITASFKNVRFNTEYPPYDVPDTSTK